MVKSHKFGPMKKYLLFVVAVTALFMSCASPTRGIVRNPEHKHSNSPNMRITSVELSNTETIIEVDISFPAESGYWVCFNETTYLITDRGTRYQIRYVDNLKLGEKYYMPKSGYAKFTLRFPPMDSRVQSFSFMEMNAVNGWDIHGIQLNNMERVRR